MYHRLQKPEVRRGYPQQAGDGGGKALKLKPAKKKPAHRSGKNIYTDEAIASLRLIGAFFWYTCGRTKGSQLLAPLIRQHMPFIASWPAFGIIPSIREKPLAISPALKGKASNTASLSAPFTPRMSVNSPVLSQSTPADFSPAPLRTDRFPASISSPSPMSLQAGFPSSPSSTRPTAGPSPSSRTSTQPSPSPSGDLNQVITIGAVTQPALSLSSAQETIRKTTAVCGPPIRVEQKSGAVVREYIGYDRLEGEALLARLAQAYRPSSPIM
ncbi:MAG: hypothetical protein LBP88_07765 [Treponema sp.]|jgi:hypothetical protein|nr:hypothetical protein [Treponema sp.]